MKIKRLLDILKLLLVGLSIYNLILSANIYWILVASYWLLNYIDGKLGRLK